MLSRGVNIWNNPSQFAVFFGAEIRNFTTLVAAGSKHYTIPSITLSGDFEIEIDFTKDVNTNQLLLGLDSDATNLIGEIGGNWQVRINNVNENFGVASAETDGKLHSLKLTRVGSTVELFINGSSRGSNTNQTGNLVLDRIADNGFSLLWSGVIANAKITDAGTLKRFYKLDETWIGPSTVAVDSGSDGSNGTAVNITIADSETFTRSGNDFLGADIWTHGDISAVSAASGFVGGVSVTAVSGFRYKFFYDVANFVEGSTTAIVGAAGASRTANGTFTDIITATGTSAGWDVATNPTTLDVNNGIIKRILEGA